jgi:hypothetical protein
MGCSPQSREPRPLIDAPAVHSATFSVTQAKHRARALLHMRMDTETRTDLAYDRIATMAGAQEGEERDEPKGAEQTDKDVEELCKCQLGFETT